MVQQSESCLAEGLGRTYPVLIAAECGIEEECLQSIWALLSKPDLWALMPDDSLVAQKVGLAHRMLSRAGALVYKDLQLLHERFPFKLFLLIKHPGLGKSLKQEAACSMDPFTLDFVGKYDLEDPCTRHVLLLLAMMMRTSIADIECKHAALRRMLARVQARGIELEALATAWVGQRARRRRMEAEDLGLSAATDAATEEEEPHAQKVRAPGLWRAFVALESVGQKGSPDLAALSKRYGNLAPEEVGPYQRLSDMGKLSRQAGDATRGLGIRAKDRQRAIEQRREEVAIQRMPTSEVGPEAAALAIDDFVVSDLSLDDALRLSRQQCRLIEKKQRSLDKEGTQALRAYQSCGSGASQEELVPHTPLLQSVVGQMRRVSCPGLLAYQFQPNTEELATQLVAYSKANASRTNLRPCVDAWWQGRHKFVLHKDCPPIQENPGEAVSPCWAAGVCMCGDRGALLKRFCVGLLGHIKQVCRRGSSNFQDLRASQLYVLIEGRAPPTAAEGYAEEDPPQEVQFWHIAYMSASPYEIIVQDMVWDGTEGPRGRVTLEATGQWYCQYQAIKMCQDFRALRWQCKLYRLDDSQRPVMSFSRGTVGAYPLEPEATVFMNRRLGARRPNRYRQHPRDRGRPPTGPDAAPLEDVAEEGGNESDAAGERPMANDEAAEGGDIEDERDFLADLLADGVQD